MTQQFTTEHQSVTCPRCGGRELKIDATDNLTATVIFDDTGNGEVESKSSNGVEWNEDSGASCSECGYGQLVRDFSATVVALTPNTDQENFSSAGSVFMPFYTWAAETRPLPPAANLSTAMVLAYHHIMETADPDNGDTFPTGPQDVRWTLNRAEGDVNERSVIRSWTVKWDDLSFTIEEHEILSLQSS